EPAKLPASVLAAPLAAEPVECGAEAFKLFATKVQPVLMNVCAGCHAGDKAGKFRLERVYADSLNARPATQANLAAVMAVIDREKPAGSPLLQRATAAHGGAVVPPLRDRDVPAFKHLDEWVRLVSSDTSSPAAPAAATEVVGTAAPVPPAAEKSDFGAGGPKKDVAAAPKDPFDPTIFNQQHHPDGPKPAAPPAPATPP
ncbi:MAG TPA: hypothetical protein VGF55_11530, partial [Gemmataceae bacterium]